MFLKFLNRVSKPLDVNTEESAETVAILRRRLADRTGNTKTLDEVFTELAEKHGFSLNDEEV